MDSIVVPLLSSWAWSSDSLGSWLGDEACRAGLEEADCRWAIWRVREPFSLR